MKYKKIFASLLCFLFVSAFTMVLFVPVFASDMNSVYLQPTISQSGIRAFVYDGDAVRVRSASPNIVYMAQYHLTTDILDTLEANLDYYSAYHSLTASFKVSDAYDDPAHTENGYLIPMFVQVEIAENSTTTPIPLLFFESFDAFYAYFSQDDGSGTPFEVMRAIVENGGSASVTFQSLTPNPGFYIYSEEQPPEPLYKSAWDLFVKFIYGEGAELTPEQTLTLTLISTLAVLILVALPFLIVFGVIKGLFG